MMVHPKNDTYSKSKLTMVNINILSDGLMLVQHSAMHEEIAVKCECVKISLHQIHGCTLNRNISATIVMILVHSPLHQGNCSSAH